MLKIIGKIALLVVLVFLLAWSMRNYLTGENPIKEASQGIYHPGWDIELEGTIYENINNSAFYFDVFGFNKPILVTFEQRDQPFPDSKLHTLAIWGSFYYDGTFYMKEGRITYFHITKYIVSFIGLIWFLVIFFKEWKITIKGFEERKNA